MVRVVLMSDAGMDFVLLKSHLVGASHKAPAEPKLRSLRNVAKELNWQEHCHGLAPRCLKEYGNGGND